MKHIIPLAFAAGFLAAGTIIEPIEGIQAIST